MTHQEKLEFALQNTLCNYPPYNPPNLKPYSPGQLAAELGVTTETLISGNSVKASVRLDRYCQYLKLGLKLGLSKLPLICLLHEPLTEGVIEDDDCHISLSHAIMEVEMSDSEFHIILNIGMKTLLLLNPDLI